MPSLISKDYQVAKVELTNMKWDLLFQTKYEFSDKYADGEVISTEPSVGEPLKKGDTVLLIVSKGPEEKPFKVPNFAGKTLDAAALEAENLGLMVGTHSEEFSDAPEGTVIKQSIAADTEAKKGDTITFTVSKGPEPVEPVMVQYTYHYAIPDTYADTVRVEFRLNDSIVDTVQVDTTVTREGDYTFMGEQGTEATVVVYVNGKEEISEVITF
jgi:serine/threonine-protein kinase